MSRSHRPARTGEPIAPNKMALFAPSVGRHAACSVSQRKVQTMKKTRIALWAVVVVLLPFFACNSEKSYPVSFLCEADGGAGCPPGNECPVVPEGPDACGGDLPGTFGHPPMPIDMARPVG